MLVGSGHCGYWVTLVEDFGTGQQVVAGHLSATGGVRIVRSRHILAGNHGFYAGQGQCLADVNRLNDCMGVGAAKYLTVVHTGSLEIGAVLGSSGHLIGAVMANGASPHDFVL